MPNWLLSLFDNSIALKVNAIIGIILLAFFICYFFSKEGRDERGRKVIAIAAVCAFVVLFIAMNWLGYVYESQWGIKNGVRALNCAQLAYTAVLLTADIAVLIVRKMKL